MRRYSDIETNVLNNYCCDLIRTVVAGLASDLPCLRLKKEPVSAGSPASAVGSRNFIRPFCFRCNCNFNLTFTDRSVFDAIFSSCKRTGRQAKGHSLRLAFEDTQADSFRDAKVYHEDTSTLRN